MIVPKFLEAEPGRDEPVVVNRLYHGLQCAAMARRGALVHGRGLG